MKLTEALRGDRDDCVEAGHCTEVDGVECDLNETRQENGVYRHASRRDFAKQIGVRQPLVSRKGIQRPRSFRHKRIRCYKADDRNHGYESRGSSDAASRIEDNFDDWNTSRSRSRRVKVADAEAQSDEPSKAGDEAHVDSEHDGARGLFACVLNFLRHMSWRIVAAHAIST